MDRTRRIDFLKKKAMQYVFSFANPEEKALWEEELRGQLSDGMWENSWNGRHFNDWKFWTGLKTTYGNKTAIIRNDNQKLRVWEIEDIDVKVGFTRLIPYVGDRMLDIIRKHTPTATKKDLRKHLQAITQAVKEAKYPFERK